MEKFGLLGKSLVHSFSPQIHAMLGNYSYSLIEVDEESLPLFMQTNKLQGFNVTIPYKQKVMLYLPEISPLAQTIGSVNTVIRRRDGSLFGDNTDAWGFEKLLGDCHEFVSSKALVLGSGGSSKTVQAVLRQSGIDAVVISRNGDNNYSNLDKHTDARLIVNTTPLGMYPRNEDAPLSLNRFTKCRMVIDLIYNPYRTKLLQQADELLIEGRGGILMLAAQAQRASELWGLTASSEDKSTAIAEKMSKTMRNLVFIGMPGSGKTALARVLHELTGRPVYDTDEWIENKTGKKIPQIIECEGINAFRQLEEDIVIELSKLSGAIIATGGGVVTRPQNLPRLRQNSRIVWIKRDLASLPLDDRPLSRQRGVEALYAERKGLYKTWSERTFKNVDIKKTATEIMEAML